MLASHHRAGNILLLALFGSLLFLVLLGVVLFFATASNPATPSANDRSSTTSSAPLAPLAVEQAVGEHRSNLPAAAHSGPLPLLGPQVPSTFVGTAPPHLFRWNDHSSIHYGFEIEAKVGSRTLVARGENHLIPTRRSLPRRSKKTESSSGSGTGFLIHPQGIIMTCAHVVEDATRVQTAIQGKIYDAVVIAVEPSSDLALVRVAAEGLPYLEFAPPDSVRLAQDVRAMGYPLSDLLGESLKVTRGAVSGISDDPENPMLQLDATVNPGNSGGPVMDEHGRVIGIVSQLMVGSQISEVAFAVPGDLGMHLADRTQVPFGLAQQGHAEPPSDMVARVSPAIVLLKVESEPQEHAFEQPYELNFIAQSSRALDPTERPVGDGQEQGTLIVDAIGQVSQAGQQQLPFMLGPISMLGVEQLPRDSRHSWSSVTPVVIQLETSTPLTGGFDPHRPFSFRRRSPFDQRGATRVVTHEGIEVVSYHLGDSDSGAVQLVKKYDMEIPGAEEDDPPRFAIAGTGTAQFDPQLGLVQAMEYHVMWVAFHDERTTRIPLTVKYELGSTSPANAALATAASAAATPNPEPEPEPIAASVPPATPVMTPNPPTTAPIKTEPQPGPAPKVVSQSPPTEPEYPDLADVTPSPRLDLFNPDP